MDLAWSVIVVIWPLTLAYCVALFLATAPFRFCCLHRLPLGGFAGIVGIVHMAYVQFAVSDTWHRTTGRWDDLPPQRWLLWFTLFIKAIVSLFPFLLSMMLTILLQSTSPSGAQTTPEHTPETKTP